MDSGFWRTRLAAAKRRFNTQQSSQFDRYVIDDIEVEEDVRIDYPCPYCFDEYDIASLCSHLEDEHPYDSKATVCPVCSVNVASDLPTHITMQHGHLSKVQRRRRLRRIPLPNTQSLSLLGKDLREAHLQALLGASGSSGVRSSNRAISSSSLDHVSTDPSLSSFFPSSDNINFNNDEISKAVMLSMEENTSKGLALQPKWKSSYFSSLSREEREERIKQEALRAGFVQDLMVSALLAD